MPLQINPRLLNPDEAFINETGQIVEVSHAVYTQDGLMFACVPQPGHKQTNLYEDELTFLTFKYDWHTYASADKWSKLIDQARDKQKYGDD